MATPSGKRGESCMDAGIVSRDRKSIPDVPAFDRRTEGRHVQTATGSLSSESRRLYGIDGLALSPGRLAATGS